MTAPPFLDTPAATRRRRRGKHAADLRTFFYPQAVGGIRAGTVPEPDVLHTCGHSHVHRLTRVSPRTCPQVVQNGVHSGDGRLTPRSATSGAGSRPRRQPVPAPRSPEPPNESTTEPAVSLPAQPCPDPVRVAAFNAVAIASLAYQQEVMTLGRQLACAHTHGLDVAELCHASGLDEPFVRRLLAEAAA